MLFGKVGKFRPFVFNVLGHGLHVAFGCFVIFAVEFFKDAVAAAYVFQVSSLSGQFFDFRTVALIKRFGLVEDFRRGFDFPAAKAVGQRVGEDVVAIACGNQLQKTCLPALGCRGRRRP